MRSEKRSIQPDDLYKLVSIEDPQVSPDGKWIAFVQVKISRLDNEYLRTIWLCAVDGAGLYQLTRSGKDHQPRWSPNGRMIAFASSRNDKSQIYLMSIVSPGGEPYVVTNMINGAHSPNWSPDGTKLAFLTPMNAEERAREDRGESETPARDKLESGHRKERREADERLRNDPTHVWRAPYRAGTSFLDDRYTQIYVIAAASYNGEPPKPRRITDVDANYDPPSWSPDSRYLYSSRQIKVIDNEPLQDMGLFKIRAEDGEETPIDVPGFSAFDPVPSPDGNWIAFCRRPKQQPGSLFSSIRRLAVMSIEDARVYDLNLELDRSTEKFAWTPDSQAVIFTAEGEGIAPIYRADVVTHDVGTVATGDFTAVALDVGKNGLIAFSASTPDCPTELYSVAPGGPAKRGTEFNRHWLDEVTLQEHHEMWFTTPSGNRIQGWYLLPVGYEAGKRYPLVLNIHGGPPVMWGPGTASMLLEWQYHAAQGYVVFYCNPRGSAGYGEAFQKSLHAAWGDVAFEDIMAGVDALLERGFVDPDRMAITGGSYGGYMTAWSVGHTDRFKCAVSQRGVYNLISFFGTSDIPSLISGDFDTYPWENHEFLWKHSPVAYADKIKTPLLIIHAENDYRVPIEQAEQLFAFVRYSGGTVEMWRYPRDGHELSRSGEPLHRIDRLEKMVEWFDRYCKA